MPCRNFLNDFPMHDQNHSDNLSFEKIKDFWFAYASDHSQTVPDYLISLERETHQKILQPRMLSGPLQGRLLSLISNMIQPKTILEIGTFTGYATLCLAEGLSKNGIIHTIDCNEELIPFQKSFFEKSPFKDNIICHLGVALDVISKITGPFDLVFIDADKINYAAYFDCVIEKMNRGGIILSDNVLWSGKVLFTAEEKDEATLALQAYNKKVKSDPRVQSVILPLRDGLTISRVL